MACDGESKKTSTTRSLFIGRGGTEELFFGVFDDVFFVFIDDGRLGGLVVDLFVAADAEREDNSPEADNRIDSSKGDQTGVDRVSAARASGVVGDGSCDTADGSNGCANQELLQGLFATSCFITITHTAYYSRFSSVWEE